MGILDFIFGKKPLLRFTKDGKVRHDHPDSKWQNWKNRFEKNSQYNWQEHSGTQKLARMTVDKKV